MRKGLFCIYAYVSQEVKNKFTKLASKKKLTESAYAKQVIEKEIGVSIANNKQQLRSSIRRTK